TLFPHTTLFRSAQHGKACHGRVLLGRDGHSGSRARVSPVSGWAGSSTRLPIAAAALTPAATRQAALKPWKNALEAAAWTAFARAGWPLTLVRSASWSAPPTAAQAARA